MENWSIDKGEDDKYVLVLNDNAEETTFGRILDVEVPSDDEYEDNHVKVTNYRMT